MTDVERFLDSDKSAGNDPLVVTEKGARQHNDRNDACRAGERKVVGNSTRSAICRIAAESFCPAAPLVLSHARAPPLTEPYRLWGQFYQKIDRRSGADHNQL